MLLPRDVSCSELYRLDAVKLELRDYSRILETDTGCCVEAKADPALSGVASETEDTLMRSALSSWVFGAHNVRSQADAVRSAREAEAGEEGARVGSKAEFLKLRENLHSRKAHHVSVARAKQDTGRQARHLRSVGVMLKLSERANRICISQIISGSHAAGAGLQVGDVVAQVDGAPADAEALDEVIGSMTGEPSSAVKLTLLRNLDHTTHVLEETVMRDVPVDAMDIFASPGHGDERDALASEPRYIIKTAQGSMQVAVDSIGDGGGTVFLSPVRNIPVFEYPDHSSG